MPETSPRISSWTVERAVPADFPAIAELTLGIYLGEGLASEGYAPQLADVEGRAAKSDLLVVRDGGAVVGSVALVLEGDFGEVTESEDEASFRMLAVSPAVRGQGVGEVVVRSCLDTARAAGKRRMVISTDPRMAAAHRLYERLGFRRLPSRDWSPVPGVDLWVYALDL